MQKQEQTQTDSMEQDFDEWENKDIEEWGKVLEEESDILSKTSRSFDIESTETTSLSNC